MCKQLGCFLDRFTQLTKILHDRRSRQIPSLRDATSRGAFAFFRQTIRLEYSGKMALQSITEFNSYSFILHFLVFACLCLCLSPCICIYCIYYAFHAFPKVATLPDTEPTACPAGDEMKQHFRYFGGGWEVGHYCAQ